MSEPQASRDTGTAHGRASAGTSSRARARADRRRRGFPDGRRSRPRRPVRRDDIPAEKAMNFGPSAKRLLGGLRPERLWLALVCCSPWSAWRSRVIGPKLLGEGTNLIFSGVVSKQLPAGVSKDAGDRRSCGPTGRTSRPTCSAP